MAKHLFDDDNAFSRVYHEDPVTVIVTFLRPEDGFIVENTVPARPTGAHRQSDNVWADANVVILVDDPVHGPSFECPREWQDGMSVGFDYITVPSV